MSKKHTHANSAGNKYPILENLFGSRLRIKVLKFLFRNYPLNVELRELARRVQEPLILVKQEIGNLEKMGLIKKI